MSDPYRAGYEHYARQMEKMFPDSDEPSWDDLAVGDEQRAWRAGFEEYARALEPVEGTSWREVVRALIERGRSHYAESMEERDIIDSHFFKTFLDDLETTAGDAKPVEGPSWRDQAERLWTLCRGKTTSEDEDVAAIARALRDAYGEGRRSTQPSTTIEACAKEADNEAEYWRDRECEGVFASENIAARIRRMASGC